MYGKVVIEDLILECHIGVTGVEKKKRQKLLVSVFMDFDPAMAIKTDDLKDTINYSTIHTQILDLAKTSFFNLIETFASEITEICLQQLFVTKVKVVVKKPHLYEDVKSVGVVIEKEK